MGGAMKGLTPCFTQSVSIAAKMIVQDMKDDYE